MKKGILFIVSGPSGVGKGTVSKALLEGSNGKMVFSVSATTRSPRPGEVHGREYFFVSDDEFNRMIDEGEFIEYMKVFGRNNYGTPRKYVEEQLNMGHDVLLDIDVNGAMKVKENCPEAVALMLAPPSMKELRRRLETRGTEEQPVIERRLAEAKTELSRMGEYDYVVVNDDLDSAIEKCRMILEASKSTPQYCSDFVDALIAEDF
ncbi:MAG: guanylate kinase [Clostridia bacterium]|nr:guanylate kinase [Clostridia bacterium]MBR5714454.1 guanylate kinase [Clostridia bacterium]